MYTVLFRTKYFKYILVLFYHLTKSAWLLYHYGQICTLSPSLWDLLVFKSWHDTISCLSTIIEVPFIVLIISGLYLIIIQNGMSVFIQIPIFSSKPNISVSNTHLLHKMKNADVCWAFSYGTFLHVMFTHHPHRHDCDISHASYNNS